MAPVVESGVNMIHPKSDQKTRFLNFTWGVGDELTIFASPSLPVSKRVRTVEAAQETSLNDTVMQSPEKRHEFTVVTMSWDQLPSDFRKLVRSGHAEFLKLQSINTSENTKESSDESTGHSKLMAASQVLRQSLEQSVELLRKRSTNPMLSEFGDKMKLASVVWAACEIMGIDTEIVVSPSLVKWLTQSFPRLDPVQYESIVQDVTLNGSDSAHFWFLIHDYCIHGDLLDAWILLQKHSKYMALSSTADKNEVVVCFGELRELLLTKPRMVNKNDGVEDAGQAKSEDLELYVQSRLTPDRLVEFQSQTQNWKKLLRHFASTHGSVIQYCGLSTLVNILLGDVDTILSVLTTPNDCWAHVLTSILLYNVCSCQKGEIADLAISCMEFKCSEKEKDLFLSVFKQDFTKTLQLLDTMIGDAWVTAHLGELLCHSGSVECVSMETKPSIDSNYFKEKDFMLTGQEVDIREYFISKYAIQLGLDCYQSHRRKSSHTNWRIAVDYLAVLRRDVLASPLQPSAISLGRVIAELVLVKQEPVSDRHARKLLFGCHRLQLPNIAQAIRRERAMFWWCNNGGRGKYMSPSVLNSFHGVANALQWAGPECSRLFIRTLHSAVSLQGIQRMLPHIPEEGSTAFIYNYRGIRRLLLEATELLHGKQEVEVAWAKRDLALVKFCKAIESEQLPIRFWFDIMKEIILWEINAEFSKVVAQNPPMLSIGHCALLMHALEDVELTAMANSEADQVSLVRFMLVQALGRAVIMVGVCKT